MTLDTDRIDEAALGLLYLTLHDGGFSDYALRHDDLKVTIAPDALAAFYRIGDRHLLDHSPDVLGKVESDTSWPSGT